MKVNILNVMAITCLLSISTLALARPLPVNFDLFVLNKDTDVQESYHVIHEGIFTLETTSKSVSVVDNQNAYSGKLSELSNDAPNTVDFTSNKILIIEAGVSPNTGFGVRFNGMIELEDYVVADISYLTPSNGPACSYMFAMTNPYIFVQIKTDKPILVTERIQQRKCVITGLDLELAG
jgi:hypothetical protein